MSDWKNYIGVKVIKARPLACRKDVHQSKKGDPGYEVMYEGGYVSWSPKEIFERAYREMNDWELDR
jgi:hypothetical protein